MARLLLKFPQKLVAEPITAQVILESNVPINILSANVTPKGGEILAEVSSTDVDKVATLFKNRGVIVAVHKRVEVNSEKCIHCGACYSICPVDAINFREDYAVVFDADRCVSCGLCVDTCPARAICL
jgi:NAD-dependent dihydropyrimidine dehydrogenase PreA subunit